MRKWTGFAVCLTSICLLVGGISQLPAQEKTKAGKPKFLYGHDLSVRPSTEKNTNAKTPRIGMEVYKDDAAGICVAISEAGSIAAGPIVPLGTKKDCQWITGMNLSARKPGELEFTQKTQKYGLELYKDLGGDRLIYISQTGALAFAPISAQLAGDREQKWLYGLDVRARDPEAESFEKAKIYGVEVYKDENSGELIYISDAGAISTTSATKEAPEKAKVVGPKHAYGLVLQVRKAEELDFSPQTKRVMVEVFEDPNANVLLYLTEPGFIATVPYPGKLQDNKPPTWKQGITLAARKVGEKEIGKAKKYGIEVFQDNRTGNTIIVSETGSIAVLAKP